MPIEDGLVELKKEISEFSKHLVRMFRDTTIYPDLIADAQSMEGVLADQIMDELMARVLKHTQVINKNEHKTTPTQLGTYSTETFDERLGLLLDKNSDSPLSFYGDREYIPPTVSGSFESGVNWAPLGAVGLFLEDNGTLMMLRSGSDGVTAGVYYAYLRNALNTSLLTEIVMTNAVYKPAYFPADLQAAAVLYANQDVIIGIMINKVTRARSGYFISLTNDTYDQTKHTGIIIPEGNVIKANHNGRRVYGLPMGYLKGDKLVLMTNMDVDDPNVGGYKVYTIAKNDLITGVYRGATPVTGWTINRGKAGTVTRDHLVYCDNALQHMKFTDPRVAAADGTGAGNPPASVRRNTKTEEIEMVGFTCAWPTITPYLFTQLVLHMPWAFKIPDSRVIDVARFYDDPPVYGVNAQDTGFVHVSGKYAVPAGPSYFGAFAWSHNICRTLFTENNYVFTYQTYDLYTLRYLGRYKYADNAKPLEILEGSAAAQTAIQDLYEGRYASPVTTLFAQVTNYGDYVVTGLNKGWTPENKVAFRYFRAGTVGALDYPYGSLTGLKLSGYIPTSDRQWVDDFPGRTDNSYEQTVNETDATGWNVSTARFDSHYYKNAPGWKSIDANLVGTTRVTCAVGVPDKMKAQVKAIFEGRGLPSLNWNGSESTWVDLVIPQRYTDLSPFVYGHHLASDRNCYFFIAKVNIQGSRTNITDADIIGASLVSIIQPVGATTAFNIGGRGTSTGGQVAIRRVAGGWTMGISTFDRYVYYGNSVANVALINFVGDKFTFVNNEIHYDQQDISLMAFLNYPTHGLMVSFCAENHRWAIDCGTKLLGIVAAKDQPATDSLGTLMARMFNPLYSNVMLSQQTVTAWAVYFSDPTPAMVNGRYYEMPLYTHYLDSATSKNKTFYCWVIKRPGQTTLEYYITLLTTRPAGVEGSIYIGFFNTDNNGLSKVAIAKRIAVADMLLSPDIRGESIPLTSGVPATYGRLNWR